MAALCGSRAADSVARAGSATSARVCNSLLRPAEQARPRLRPRAPPRKARARAAVRAALAAPASPVRARRAARKRAGAGGRAGRGGGHRPAEPQAADVDSRADRGGAVSRGGRAGRAAPGDWPRGSTAQPLAAMNRVFRRAFSTTGRVLAEAEAAAAEATELRLNLAVPARALISGAEVARVTLPGRAGRFGVEKSSPSMLAELRPGVVNVIHLDGRSEDFFVPGGFAFVHGDNRIDVSTPEGVRVEDLDAGECLLAPSPAPLQRGARRDGRLRADPVPPLGPAWTSAASASPRLPSPRHPSGRGPRARPAYCLRFPGLGARAWAQALPAARASGPDSCLLRRALGLAPLLPLPPGRRPQRGSAAARPSKKCARAFPRSRDQPRASVVAALAVACAPADRVREMAAISSAKRDSTAAGTKDHAKAVVELEVYKEIGRAVGVNL